MRRQGINLAGMTPEDRLEYQREIMRAWRARNRERDQANTRAWKAANPEKAAEYSRRHREKDPEGHRERSRAYRAAHPEVVYANNHKPGASEKRRLAAARWRAENGDEYRAKAVEKEALRRARKRGVEYEHVDRAAIISRDRAVCHLCRKRVAKKDIALDHLIPLALGGPHTAANIAVAHRSCNARKWIHAADEQLRIVG